MPENRAIERPTSIERSHDFAPISRPRPPSANIHRTMIRTGGGLAGDRDVNTIPTRSASAPSRNHIQSWAFYRCRRARGLQSELFTANESHCATAVSTVPPPSRRARRDRDSAARHERRFIGGYRRAGRLRSSAESRSAAIHDRKCKARCSRWHDLCEARAHTPGDD